MWMVVIGDHAYQGRQAALKNEMIFHLLQSFPLPAIHRPRFGSLDRRYRPAARRIGQSGGAAVIMVLRGKKIQIKSGDGGALH